MYFLLFMGMEMLLEPVVTFPEATERKVYPRSPTCYKTYFRTAHHKWSCHLFDLKSSKEKKQPHQGFKINTVHFYMTHVISIHKP